MSVMQDFGDDGSFGDAKITFGAEGGGSFYNFRDNLSETDTSYKDFVISSDVEYLLKDKGLKFGLDVKRVGALFSSPTAQSRRYNPLTAPGLFSEVKSAQSYYDRFTDEAVYNNSINVNLMPYFNIFNNLSPYGDATPNRFVVGATFTTDTSITSLESSVRFDYGTEVVGEGGEAKRTFLVLTGGGIAHLGTYLNMNRLFDVNAGIRYESTSRNEGAKIALNSLLLDLGASVEAVKKMDLLVGVKYFSAKGNEFTTVRDGFNLVTNFNEVNYDVSELVLSGGARIRFSEKQSFTINYNLVNFSDERTESAAYNLGQLFLNYTGKF
jgi:hypothetical protein